MRSCRIGWDSPRVTAKINPLTPQSRRFTLHNLSAHVDEHLVEIVAATGAGLVVRHVAPLAAYLQRALPQYASVLLQVTLVAHLR